MVTLAGVSEETVVELKKLYDYVIPVEPIYSRTPSNLQLMRRLDLNAALTKIHLWKQTQFRKVVYVDADMVAVRVPDELFDIEANFAASPDIGWPDCFNSGLMLATPDKKTYGELLELADQGATFDGADQGLLNQYFGNWHRLSFVYNCTVGNNMAYQYAPAFNHYGKDVSMAHFIGAQKPWDKGNVPGLTGSPDPYDRLSSLWWSVYNKHHGPYSAKNGQQVGLAGGQQYLESVKGAGIGGEGGGALSNAEIEAILKSNGGAPASSLTQAYHYQHEAKDHQSSSSSTVIQFRSGVPDSSRTQAPSDRDPKFVPIRSIDQPSRYHENFIPEGTAEEPVSPTPQTSSRHNIIEEGNPPPYDSDSEPPTHHQQYATEGNIGEYVLTNEGPVPQAQYFQTGAGSYHVFQQGKTASPQPEIAAEAGTFSAPRQNWDPTKTAPPQHGAPEADQLHVQTYLNEWDRPDGSSGLFVAPAIAPPPLHHLWYDIPQASPEPQEAPPSKLLFPWEAKPRQVARVFSAPTVSEPGTSNKEDNSSTREDPQSPVVGPVGFPPSRTQAASLKPVFPWEEKPRTVTRVFANDDSPQIQPEVQSEDTGYDENYGDDLPRSMVGSDEGESWKRFTSRENKWDTDPAIRDYVLGLRRRKSLAPDDVPIVPGALDEIPPVTPAPIRRTAPAWVADEGGEEEEEISEWDPERKLEELRRLPPSFVAEFVAKNMKSAGMQTDYGDLSGVRRMLPETPYPSSPAYSDSLTQTDLPSLADRSIQCQDGKPTDVGGVEVFDDEEISVTPKLSTSGLDSKYMTDTFSFEQVETSLKALASIPLEHGARTLTRGRSIDSALGSVISEE
ncbi:hypothetical protein BDD12DRAFT_260268 [Trichophaea hybrida]|nr:hypothetical protein BDD12DRAFT_260268 [Trichophaea hybrida]